MKPLGQDLKEVGEIVTSIDLESISTFSKEDACAAIRTSLDEVIDGTAKVHERGAVCVTSKTMGATSALRLRHLAAKLIWTARTLDALHGR